jgi:2-C-methyl-D-erythritol 4-phosphate cytidylyltransferase
VHDDDEAAPAVGLVPVEGRGSMPFALLHGESLVAVASWALGEAGVELLDFTTGWQAVQAMGVPLVVHDPLCAGTPVSFLAEAVRLAQSEDVVVVGSRPVTDTVKEVDDEGVLGPTHDRAELVEVTSPVVLPARVVAALPALPGTDDLADLVAGLGQEHDPVFLEAPASGRRVVDESDVRLLEALSSTDPGRPG